jgi:hypothetical protein
MNAQAATDEQIKRYQRMTGEQRLKVGLELHDMACEIAREGIRRQRPNASEAEVENFLRARLNLARGE